MTLLPPPLLLATVLVGSSGCSKRASPQADIPAGVLTGTTYVNDGLGLSITFPDGWHLVGPSEIDDQIASQYAKTSDGSLATGVKDQITMARTRSLVKGQPAPEELLPSLTVIAVKMRLSSASHFADEIKKSLSRDPAAKEMKYSDPRQTALGGRHDALCMDASLPPLSADIHLHFRYCHVPYGLWGLHISTAWSNAGEGEVITGIMSAMRLGPSP